MSLEEFQARQLEEIKRRWLLLARDLTILRDGGTIKDEMTLKEVLEILSQGPK